MRILLLILIVATCSTLSGQTEANNNLRFKSEAGHWQISGDIYFPTNRRGAVDIYTSDSAFNNVLSRTIREPRAIMVDGVEYTYYWRGTTLEPLLDPSGWYTIRMGLYRQFQSGFSVHVNGFLSKASYTKGLGLGSDGVTQNLAYNRIKESFTGYGGLVGIDYHFLRTDRIQIYAGFAVRTAVHSVDFEQPQFVVPELEYVETANLIERQLSLTVFDNDITVSAGVLYRLTPKFSLGLSYWSNGSSRRTQHLLLGANIRYWWQ